MIHKIALNFPENVLTVKEPDERVWVFFFQRGDERPKGLAVFLNSRFLGVASPQKKWRSELSSTLKLQLKEHVPTDWLDKSWETEVFPQIEKVIVEFNKDRRKVDGA